MDRSHFTSTQVRALIAAARGPISTRGQAGRFKRETLTALADLGLVELSSRFGFHARADDLETVATITPAGRQALAALPPRPRRPIRAAVAFAALLASCGVAAEPIGMDASTDVAAIVSPVPRRPCVPNMPDTCLLGRCVADAEGFACVGTPWPQICKWHTCSVGDASTCETREGTVGGQCVAVEGPTRGCCLYPSPIQW